jgi:hypothetical protein
VRSALAARTPILLALVAGAVATGCAADAALPMVRTRAVYDLDCPNEDIRIEEAIGGRFKAIGCGRKARYQAACDGLRCIVRGEGEPGIPWRDRPEPTEPGR